MDFFRRYWGFIVPLTLLPPVGLSLLAAGCNADKVMIFIMFATIAEMMGTLAYIVLFDSRKRWPGVGALERFIRVMSFYRG